MREPREKTQTLNDDTYASDPGLVELSETRLRRLQPELYYTGWKAWLNPVRCGRSFWRTRIEEQLSNGDSRAALVMQLQPLLVAAYTVNWIVWRCCAFPMDWPPKTDCR